MKKHLHLFLFLLCIPLYGVGQNSDAPYSYPLLPGTEAWAALTSGDEKFEACQIPETCLRNMSTAALAETCLNYPLCGEYVFSNNERNWAASLIERFNGLKELSTRQNGASELLKLYDKMPVQLKNYVDEMDGSSFFRLGYIELLLSNDVFLNRLTESEIQRLQEISTAKYEEKLNAKDTYSIFYIKKSMLLTVQSLQKRNIISSLSNQTIIDDFIDNYESVNAQTLQECSKILFSHER